MKKVVSIIICIALALSFSSCKFSSKKKEELEREEYVKSYLRRLNNMDAIISQKLIEDEKNANEPWLIDSVRLPDSEITVSLYFIRQTIYVYEVDTGKETELTAEDVIDLYTVPNEEKQAEYDELYKWFGNGKSSYAISGYYSFVYTSYNLYKETYGKSFIDKDLEMYTADERHALVKWGIENIEGNYYKEKRNEVEKTSQ